MKIWFKEFAKIKKPLKSKRRLKLKVIISLAFIYCSFFGELKRSSSYLETASCKLFNLSDFRLIKILLDLLFNIYFRQILLFETK